MIEKDRGYRRNENMSDLAQYIGRVLGDNVKRLRTQNGLTLNKFAEKVGLKPITIAKIEEGSRLLSLKSLVKICFRMDVPVFSLLIEDPVGSRAPIERICHLFEGRSPEQQEFLMETLEANVGFMHRQKQIGSS